MAGSGWDAHRQNAERAEQLAKEARRRISSSSSAAERHERLARTGDIRHGELHIRAAVLQRDAQLIFESAAALHQAHADHERRAAAALTASDSAARPPVTPAPADPPALTDRYRRLARQQALADQRDEVADLREHAADERERLADARERSADERDAVANARDNQLEARERHLANTPPDNVVTYGRAHAARAEATTAREEHRSIRQAWARDRDAAQAVRDQAAIDREEASSQRHGATGAR